MLTKKHPKMKRKKVKPLSAHEYDFAYFSKCDHDDFSEGLENCYSVFFNPIAFVSSVALTDKQIDILFKNDAPFFNIRVVSSTKRQINATYENCLFNAEHENTLRDYGDGKEMKYISTYSFYPTAPGFIEIELAGGKKYKVYWELASDGKKVVISDFAKRKALFCPYTLKLGEIMNSEDAKVYKNLVKAQKELKSLRPNAPDESKIQALAEACDQYEKRRTIYLAKTHTAPIKID